MGNWVSVSVWLLYFSRPPVCDNTGLLSPGQYCYPSLFCQTCGCVHLSKVSISLPSPWQPPDSSFSKYSSPRHRLVLLTLHVPLYVSPFASLSSVYTFYSTPSSVSPVSHSISSSCSVETRTWKRRSFLTAVFAESLAFSLPLFVSLSTPCWLHLSF